MNNERKHDYIQSANRLRFRGQKLAYTPLPQGHAWSSDEVVMSKSTMTTESGHVSVHMSYTFDRTRQIGLTANIIDKSVLLNLNSFLNKESGVRLMVHGAYDHDTGVLNRVSLSAINEVQPGDTDLGHLVPPVEYHTGNRILHVTRQVCEVRSDNVVKLSQIVPEFVHNGLVYYANYRDDDKTYQIGVTNGNKHIWGVLPEELWKYPLVDLYSNRFLFSVRNANKLDEFTELGVL